MKNFGEHMFPLGQIVATPGAVEAIELSGQNAGEFIARHATGDWGELDEHDKRENAIALKDGLRILSAYHTTAGEKIWIITEHDRSVTTVLLPSEY